MRLLSFVLLLSILVGCLGLIQIDWGIVYPIDAKFTPLMRRAIDLKVKELNDNEFIPGAEIVLSTVPIEVLMTKTEKMQTVVESIMDNTNISTMIGFHTSRQVADPNAISAIFKIPMLGSAASSPQFSDKTEYPYFGRIITQSGKIGLATGDFAQFSGFRRGAHLGSTTYSVGRVEPIAKSFEEAGIQFIGSKLHDTLVDEPVDVVVKQMENILLHYKELGINIITYTSQNEEGHLVLWTAWRLGMLGPQPDAFETNFDVDQEWYENVWLPNVTPDKLSDEEIRISESDDWDRNFINFVVFAYDAPLFMANVINSYCASVSDTMTLEECYMHLPNAGDEIMKHYTLVEVEGITGTMKLDENLDRDMNQVMYQWLGQSFETSAYWTQYFNGPQINYKLGNTTQGSFEWVRPPKYMTMDSIAPETIQLSSSPNMFRPLSYLSGLIAILVTVCFIYLQKSDKRQMMRSRQFFTSGMVVWMTIATTIALLFKLTNALLMISPGKSMVPIGTFFQYFDWVPMMIVTSSIASRLYRFCKVTNNKKMRSIKFSKYHSLYACVIAVSIPMIFVLYWIFKTVDQTGTFMGSFEKLYTLQDEKPHRFFELAPALYKLHTQNKSLATLNLLVKGGCMVALAVNCLVLARMSQQRNGRGVSHSNKQIDSQMSVLERSFALVCIVFICESVFEWLQHRNDMSLELQKVNHIGFDNIGHNVTFDNLVTKMVIKISSSIVVWTIVMSTIFICSLKHPWRVLLKKGLDTDASSTATLSTNGNPTVNCTVGHGITLDLAARLQMASFTLDGGSGTTGSYQNHSIAVKYNDTGSNVIKRATSRTVSVGASRTISNNLMFESGSLSMTNGTKFAMSMAGIERKMSITDTTKEFDARNFMKELKGMDTSSLISAVGRLKSEVERLISSTGRIYAQLYKLDSKLSDELFSFEILSVKNKRCFPNLVTRSISSIPCNNSKKYDVTSTTMGSVDYNENSTANHALMIAAKSKMGKVAPAS